MNSPVVGQQRGTQPLSPWILSLGDGVGGDQEKKGKQKINV